MQQRRPPPGTLLQQRLDVPQPGDELPGTPPCLGQFQPDRGVARSNVESAHESEPGFVVASRCNQHPAPLPQAIRIGRRDCQGLERGLLGLGQALLRQPDDRQRAPSVGQSRRIRHGPLRPPLGRVQLSGTGEHEGGLHLSGAVVGAPGQQRPDGVERAGGVALLQRPPALHAQGLHIVRFLRQCTPQRAGRDAGPALPGVGDRQQPPKVGCAGPRAKAPHQQTPGRFDFIQIHQHLRQQILGGLVVWRLRQDQPEQRLRAPELLALAADLGAPQQRIGQGRVPLLNRRERCVGRIELAGLLAQNTEQVPRGRPAGVRLHQCLRRA